MRLGERRILIPLAVLSILLAGVVCGSAQVIYTLDAPSPTTVLTVGRAETLAAVRLTPAAAGTTVESSIGFLFQGIACDNDNTSGISVAAGAPFVPANVAFPLGAVLNTADGCTITIRVAGGVAVTTASTITLQGVRSRVDLSPAATADVQLNVAIAGAAPGGSSLFSPSQPTALVATSAKGMTAGVRNGVRLACDTAAPTPAPNIRISETFTVAFVQYVNAASGSPARPADARPLAGALNNTQIRIVLPDLPAGLTLTWPTVVPGFNLATAAVSAGSLQRIAALSSTTVQVYEFVTTSQMTSDSNVEQFNITPTVTLPTPALAFTLTAQAQLFPGLVGGDATSITSPPFGVPPAPGPAKPRFNDPLTAAAPLLTVLACNPVPTITSLSPTSAAAGGSAFNLTVNGSDFVLGANVRWNGNDRTTTFLSSTQVRALISEGDIATAGTADVSVANPTPGGGVSNVLTFTIQASNPAPTAASLSPTSATAGGPAFTLTVNGTNFLAGSVVRWNGSDRTTTFVSSTQLQAAITAADIATAGTAQVTVFNPSPGGGLSSALTFTINAPVPAITTLSPSSASAGGAAFTLTVNGTNFLAGSVVRWNGSDRTTTFVSSTQLGASISAADIATTGTAQVTVFNPSPGGGLSNALAFTIQEPPSFTLAASPASQSLTAGTSATFTVAINATGGFNASVNLSCSGLPSGASCSFTPNPSPPGTSALTVSTAATTPAGTATFTVTGASGSLTRTATASLTVTIVPPVFTAASVTNAASFVPAVSAGSIATIFGRNLTTAVTGIVQADRTPLTTQLRGTSVTVGGVPGPLFAVANVSGQEQINLQIPFEVAGRSTADVVVNNSGATNVPVPISISVASPGVFAVDGTFGAILHGANFQLVSSSNPAAKGEVVLLYATGLGPVSPAPPTGAAASVLPLSLATIPPAVTVGGINAPVLFAGLAPGFVGLFQVNFQLPADVPSGNLDVVVQTSGVSSRPVKIAVQ